MVLVARILLPRGALLFRETRLLEDTFQIIETVW